MKKIESISTTGYSLDIGCSELFGEIQKLMAETYMGTIGQNSLGCNVVWFMLSCLRARCSGSRKMFRGGLPFNGYAFNASRLDWIECLDAV